MTKEELKEEIIELLLKPINCKMFSDVWLEHKADQILTLIRKAGWKSPEEAAWLNDIRIEKYIELCKELDRCSICKEAT